MCLGPGWKQPSEDQVSLLNSKTCSNLTLSEHERAKSCFYCLGEWALLTWYKLSQCRAPSLGGGCRGLLPTCPEPALAAGRIRRDLCTSRSLVLNPAKEASSSSPGWRQVPGEGVTRSKAAGHLAFPLLQPGSVCSAGLHGGPSGRPSTGSHRGPFPTLVPHRTATAGNVAAPFQPQPLLPLCVTAPATPTNHRAEGGHSSPRLKAAVILLLYSATG